MDRIEKVLEYVSWFLIGIFCFIGAEMAFAAYLHSLGLLP